MALCQQWTIYDMRGQVADFTKFMKSSVAEQGNIWTDYDKKINYQWN